MMFTKWVTVVCVFIVTLLKICVDYFNFRRIGKHIWPMWTMNNINLSLFQYSKHENKQSIPNRIVFLTKTIVEQHLIKDDEDVPSCSDRLPSKTARKKTKHKNIFIFSHPYVTFLSGWLVQQKCRSPPPSTHSFFSPAAELWNHAFVRYPIEVATVMGQTSCFWLMYTLVLVLRFHHVYAGLENITILQALNCTYSCHESRKKIIINNKIL